MQRRIFSLLFLIAGVLFFQSVQAQTPLIVQPGIYHQNFDNNTDITLLPGVTDISPGGAAVNAANLAGGPFPSGTSVTVTANDAVITNTSNSIGNNNTGLRIQSAGDAIITASGKIAVTGTQSDWAILDIAQGQTATSTAMVKYGVLDASGAVVGPGGGLSTGSTVESGGIQADRRGNGDAIINASGNITGFVGAATATLTPGFYGLLAHSADTTSTSGGPFTGNAEVTYHSGKINITGEFARGILAWSDGGSATVTTDGGTKIILDSSGTNKGSSGVYAFATSNATATVASEIMNFGPATPPQVSPVSLTVLGPKTLRSRQSR